MPKIVIDTNVLVSSLIQKSYPFFIIREAILGDKIEICISNELITEYYEVLNRPKFSKYNDFLKNAEKILAEIETRGIIYHPTQKVNLLKDSDDNMILELAEKSKAHFIITGNINDFTIYEFKKTKIVTPKEFWENHYNI